MTPKLILASSSPFRRMLMENAGLSFEAHAARIDERAIEAPLEKAGAKPDAVAIVLARAKAEEVSRRFPDSLVIGSDQTMSLGDSVFHKPKDLADAASHLQALSGVTHRLNSAVAIVSDGVVLWEHLAHAELTMRPLTGSSSPDIWRGLANGRFPASAPINWRGRASSSSKRSRVIISPFSACRCCRS